MRPSSATTTIAVLLLTFFLSPVCLALTIISPFPGSTVDPSQPFTIIWTSSSADPTTITLKIENSDPSNTLASNQVLASNVPSRQGSITVPAYTIENFGTGYAIVALSESGQQVAESGSLVLADGGSGSVTTLSGGALSYVSTETTKSTSENTAKSATKTTTAATTTGAATIASTTAEQSFTMFTGTATAITGSTTGALSVPTQSTQPTGFVTSSTTRAGSASASDGSTSATSSAAANTNTANRLGVTGLGFSGMGRGEVVMGAAGVLAGVVALIV